MAHASPPCPRPNARPIIRLDDGLCHRAKPRRHGPEHSRSTEKRAHKRSAARTTQLRCRRQVDDRWAEWNRYKDTARALTRARVRRKNALEKVARLEREIAIHKTTAIQAEQQVLDLWPKVPAEQRGYFNDDLQLLDAPEVSR